jgi:hypothetical protein
MVYLAMLGGMLAGAAVGALYDAVVLGQRVGWILALCAVLGETALAARVAASRLGRPLSSSQRLKVALNYTLALGLVQAVALMFVKVDALAQFTGTRGMLLFALAAVLWMSALALLRYLLLSLFSTLRRRTKRREAHT